MIVPFFLPAEMEKVVFIDMEDGSRLFPPIPPSNEYLLGTDEFGQDLLHQVLLFGRNTLLLVFAITFFRFVLSSVISYFVGKKGTVSYWITEKMNHYLSGLPVLLLAILFMNLPIIEAATFRTFYIVFFLIIIECGRLSFLLSQEWHHLRREPFYEASIMTGSDSWFRLGKYDLRHVGPTMTVMFFQELAKVMLLIGQLGFLSMFISQQWFTMDGGPVEVQNTFGTWGSMLSDTRQYIRDEPWIPLVPIVAITLAMFTFHHCALSLKTYFQKFQR